MGGDQLARALRQTKPLQAGRGQHDGVIFSLIEPAQAGADIAAQVF